jgi:hypothetical protein
MESNSKRITLGSFSKNDHKINQDERSVPAQEQLLEWKKWHAHYRQKLKKTQFFWAFICLLSHLVVFLWRNSEEAPIKTLPLHQALPQGFVRLEINALKKVHLIEDEWNEVHFVSTESQLAIKGNVTASVSNQESEEQLYIAEIPEKEAIKLLQAHDIVLYPPHLPNKPWASSSKMRPSIQGNIHEVDF